MFVKGRIMLALIIAGLIVAVPAGLCALPLMALPYNQTVDVIYGVFWVAIWLAVSAFIFVRLQQAAWDDREQRRMERWMKEEARRQAAASPPDLRK